MPRQYQSWEVSDNFWQLVEPLVPQRQRPTDKEYHRQPGGGRKPMASRQVFEAIVFVLRTGIQWKALPRESAARVCRASSVVAVPYINTFSSGSKQVSFIVYGNGD